jgi:hypothetical protein
MLNLIPRPSPRRRREEKLLLAERSDINWVVDIFSLKLKIED